MFNQALLLILPVALAFAAANDLFTMRIPNTISLVLIGAFAVVALAAGLSWESAGLHLATGAGILAMTFAMFSFRLLGGGDAKLMAAAALWMGPEQIVPFLTYVTLFGGVLAAVILVYRRYVPVEDLGLPGWAQRLHVDGTGIPYGIAISAAGLVAYPATEIFMALSG